jgi:hypothetical protein
MDNLIGSLELSLNVSNELHSTISPHPRFSQFKKTSKTSQEVRRRRTLENQKQLIHYIIQQLFTCQNEKILILFLGAAMITTIIVDVWQRVISVLAMEIFQIALMKWSGLLPR